MICLWHLRALIWRFCVVKIVARGYDYDGKDSAPLLDGGVRVWASQHGVCKGAERMQGTVVILLWNRSPLRRGPF